MNVERLHIILVTLLEDIRITESQRLLQQLSQDLRNLVSQPQAPGHQENVSNTLKAFYEKIEKSRANEFDPAWFQSLEELGISDLFGVNLTNNVKAIFQSNQITPSVAAEQIKELSERIEKFKNSADQLVLGFKSFDFGKEELEPGECELSILIPRRAVKNNLLEFSEELKDLNKILNVFWEIKTGSAEELKIRSISSSDFNIYLEAAPVVAAFLAHAIDKVISLYKQLLEIRKLRKEMKNQNIPDDNLEGVDSHINGIVLNGIKEAVKEIFKEHLSLEVDEGRSNELKTALEKALINIAKRIDSGYNLSVKVEPLKAKSNEQSEDSDLQSSINTIIKLSNNLKYLKLEGDPILRLPESNIGKTEKKNKGSK